jgi:hypothetical protein
MPLKLHGVSANVLYGLEFCVDPTQTLDFFEIILRAGSSDMKIYKPLILKEYLSFRVKILETTV